VLLLRPPQDDLRYSQEVFGCGISKYVEQCGWHGPTTWFAHCCFVGPEDMRGFGAQGVGVAHCPSSNLRLASGIAPVRWGGERREAGSSRGRGRVGGRAKGGQEEG
jgi:cytosine/adenosine deaminase-related metal-dependent hydrolase